MNPNFWVNKRVFLTGHTGFKGGWLALWLANMGADVYGYSLRPPTAPNFFTEANVKPALRSHAIGDIRDIDSLEKAVANARPDIVFHLAAQPLVRESYSNPVYTFETNVLGTVNLLEVIRKSPDVQVVVNITTDKCYENKEWLWSYRENEPMGGVDPYSSSKACSELVTSAYRASYLASLGIKLASARAGNVIGGGDWSVDRLVPDFLKACDDGRTLKIRSPHATRPWQHVLEPLSGYLTLAEHMYGSDNAFSEAWNFGPDEHSAQSVSWIVNQLNHLIPDLLWELDAEQQPHEALMLKLDSSKAKSLLGWRARWDLKTALEMTVEWHLAWKAGVNMNTHTLNQIMTFQSIR